MCTSMRQLGHQAKGQQRLAHSSPPGRGPLGTGVWSPSSGTAGSAGSPPAAREDRLAVAGLVVDNSGTLEDLDRRIEEVWAELRQRSGHGPDTKR